MRLPAGSQGNLAEALRTVKEQLRRVPHKGIGYGLLRYLSEDAQLRQDLSIEGVPVGFNYLGQFGPGQVGQVAQAKQTCLWPLNLSGHHTARWRTART